MANPLTLFFSIIKNDSNTFKCEMKENLSLSLAITVTNAEEKNTYYIKREMFKR